MNKGTRSFYVENIAAGLRYAQKMSGVGLPEKTVLLCYQYSPLAECADIIGVPVHVVFDLGEHEFVLSAPTDVFKDNLSFYKEFQEYIDTNPIWKYTNPMRK
jgi:hypothetical protein